MSFIQEFKEFALKGNVVDMAIGVIIGGAFDKIVSSLVADIIMPPLGVLMDGANFSDLSITLKEAVGDTPAVLLPYGHFIQATVDFLILALAIFVAIKAVSRLQQTKEKEETAAPAGSSETDLLTEIRDLLKQQKND